MARILGYIATSLDGRIATAADGLDWLFKYDDMDLGVHDYRTFLAGIKTLVMGRATYDFIARQPSPWPYEGKRVIVVTSRPIEAPMGELTIRSDVDALIAELRALDDGDVWMLGGGKLQTAFLERGALDEIEIYVIPEIIGDGPLLFPASSVRASPTLIAANAIDRGCVRLHYAFK
ncbi:dihydrofolate reductase family protein [Pelagibacterium xiamenense]|uniref:dihydrofolate reductase family protein n=1 Tax=Pelagibacterium xiamenense TaxID=2901140 RepID=UPI001E2BA6CF|nr:dihydrofolate reductase family protein [Pelagibacterium xiamenense]MCD7060965.1 dihydrofolate reductase family protein [Pelagibacterium xiamenense]